MIKGDLVIDAAHCEWCRQGQPGPKPVPLSYIRLFVIVQVVFILAAGTWAGVHLTAKMSTGEPVWVALTMVYALAMVAATVFLTPRMVRDWRGVSRPKSKQ